jgi:hypothetical protein
MQDDWYYSGPEGQRGPMTLQVLRETLAQHPNARDLFIWHESLSGWIRAGDVSDVFTENLPVRGAVAPRRGSPAAFLFGVSVVALGCMLFYLGISGNVARFAAAVGFNTKVIDASPGALLFILGLLVIWLTRLRMTAK